ncbi:unnamed protein product [Tilletia laevis]|uniref:Arrestin-like N-terminal domain-containing protein n=2 Tax=Tilletia TaxID=13289 RepID=A0A177UGU7_9BASI|nr:hypothetical protein CF335_g6129 [Tilletia laevis]KAE8261254.1 hypothetical protein A4X03_0g3416 [Tilletia caries]CAD6940501.1 unnamed protein product [Tilletia controversa]KAE8194014.1 hypothetical protein CF336_g3716 [Tilletia laevis]CAD6886110.1 unnamed protein product [Tilletia caries]
MVGLGNLLGQPCSLCLHFASQDVLVYPAPHEDLPNDPARQPPPPGPDTTLSGVVEVFSPTDRTISAIRIVLRSSQTLAIPDVSPSAPPGAVRFEDASTFSRTIEVTAEHGSGNHNTKQLSRASKSASVLTVAEAQAQASASGPSSTSSASGHSDSASGTVGIYLPRGSSYFSFTFILPATLAPTHRSKNGRLRYACTAIAIGGGRARSNISSPAREIFVIALPQPESLASAGQTRATLINQAEGFNAPGMPAPIPLDVQFHDFHDSLGIFSVSLTSLSLTVGSIATLSVYHPSPPPFLNVHLIRVTIEQTAEVYNRLRRGWMRFPVEKYRLWEAGFIPFKKEEDQPIRPRRLGTVTTALAEQFETEPGALRTWPVEAGPLRRASEWEDSIWIGSSEGNKGHPGNAILDRLYVNPADAAVAAASAAQEHLKEGEVGPTSGSGASLDVRPSHYFASRPSSPVHTSRKTRSVPTTPGAASAASSHVHGFWSQANTPGPSQSSHGFSHVDARPHPNPLYATACDNPSLPYLSAISGAWIDQPVASATSSSTVPSEGPNAYRLRALLRLPSDDLLHPTTLRGTRSDVHHTHEAVVEVFFSRANVLSEEKGKEGRPKVQVFSMRKNVVIQSCVVTPDMIHLPPYGGHEPGRDPGAGVEPGGNGVAGEGAGGSGSGGDVASGLPTYSDAVSLPSTRPGSPHSFAAVETRAVSPSITVAGPSVPTGSGAPDSGPAQTQRGRPSLLRRVTSPNSQDNVAASSADHGGRSSDASAAPQSHSHLRNTISAILHPHSHHHNTHTHRTGGTSLLKRSGHSGTAAEVHMSTATAPPSRAPSRAASRESSPTRSSGRQTPPPLHPAAHSVGTSGDSHGESAEGVPATSAHQVPKQPQPQHHHRRNGFAFGFTPSSARQGEGEDSDVHHHAYGHGSSSASSNERHAHFIPSQVVGRERGRSITSSGTASPASSAALSLSHSPNKKSIALANTSHQIGNGGAGGGSGTSSSGRLTRHASDQLMTGGSAGDPTTLASSNVGMSGTAPTPARLANALRKLQLSQAQAVGSGSSAAAADTGSSWTMQAALSHHPPSSSSSTMHVGGSSLPGSGTNTPGGTLVTSGPNLPPEWNLVMAPGERTSTTHSTCMCGRTTESLLRAERLLLVGAPTAPYFTPSPAPTPSLSQRSSFAAGSSGADYIAAAAQVAAYNHHHQHCLQHHLPTPPSGDSICRRSWPGEALSPESPSPNLSPPMQRSLSFSSMPSSSPTLNVGADDPEGVLWSVGMGADGRAGGGARSSRLRRSGVDDDAGAMRRTQSATGASLLKKDDDMGGKSLPDGPHSSHLHTLGGGGGSSSSSSTRTGFNNTTPALSISSTTGDRPSPAPSSNSHSLLGLDAQAGLLEDLLERTDEFVLARGRDPDEILRRKEELMAQGPARES